MDIQIDSREKQKAIQKILKEFDTQGINYFSSKLLVGDYMNLDNPRLIIDRKQNLSEICSNVTQQHERFKAELIRANQANTDLVFLIEHGGKIKSLEDVKSWTNPRTYFYKKSMKQKHGYRSSAPWALVENDLKRRGIRVYLPTSGEALYKSLSTIRDRYGARFEFCTKNETGARIIEILAGKE